MKMYMASPLGEERLLFTRGRPLGRRDTTMDMINSSTVDGLKKQTLTLGWLSRRNEL